MKSALIDKRIHKQQISDISQRMKMGFIRKVSIEAG